MNKQKPMKHTWGIWISFLIGLPDFQAQFFYQMVQTKLTQHG
jgi:hypothetical protein